MRGAWLVTIGLVLSAAAVPVAAAQSDSQFRVNTPAGATDPVPSLDNWRQMDTAGTIDDGATAATFSTDGDQATLETNPTPGNLQISALPSQSDTFDVTWTKTNVDYKGNLWHVEVTGTSSTFGEVDLQGTWQANTVLSICTADYPTSYCNNYATGPIELTGTVGGDFAQFAGNARDTYCTSRESPDEQMAVCGDDAPSSGIGVCCVNVGNIFKVQTPT